MGQHDRIVVHVHHSRLGDHRLRHLVQVRLGGNTGADIEELHHARLGDRLDCALHEEPVVPRRGADGRERGRHLLGRAPVHLVVVLTAQHIVVDTSTARALGVHHRERGVIEFGHGRPGQSEQYGWDATACISRRPQRVTGYAGSPKSHPEAECPRLSVRGACIGPPRKLRRAVHPRRVRSFPTPNAAARSPDR